MTSSYLQNLIYASSPFEDRLQQRRSLRSQFTEIARRADRVELNIFDHRAIVFSEMLSFSDNRDYVSSRFASLPARRDDASGIVRRQQRKLAFTHARSGLFVARANVMIYSGGSHLMRDVHRTHVPQDTGGSEASFHYIAVRICSSPPFWRQEVRDL